VAVKIHYYAYDIRVLDLLGTLNLIFRKGANRLVLVAYDLFEKKTKKLPEENYLQEIAVKMSLSMHELFGSIEQEKAHCGSNLLTRKL